MLNKGYTHPLLLGLPCPSLPIVYVRDLPLNNSTTVNENMESRFQGLYKPILLLFALLYRELKNKADNGKEDVRICIFRKKNYTDRLTGRVFQRIIHSLMKFMLSSNLKCGNFTFFFLQRTSGKWTNMHATRLFFPLDKPQRPPIEHTMQI